MITLDQLVSFFADSRQMKHEGRANFDVDQVCRWSYFLVDPDRDKLIRVGHFLESQGYDVFGFLEPGPDDEQQSIYLRFDKEERHTPESLFQRNVELYKIAREFDLEDYDGMDVGGIDGP